MKLATILRELPFDITFSQRVNITQQPTKLYFVFYAPIDLKLFLNNDVKRELY